MAVKQFIGIAQASKQLFEEFMVEIKLMSALKDDHVVEFLGVWFRDDKEITLVTVQTDGT